MAKENIEPGTGPKLISQRVEYRVRKVTRYILTRYEESVEEGDVHLAGSEEYGEFDNPQTADRVGRLCAMGERSSAWDQTEIQFHDPFGTSIRLNTDGTSEPIEDLLRPLVE